MSLACRLLGHRFQPRYHTYVGPPAEPKTKLAVTQSPDQLEATRVRKEMYVCDVCERCGTVLKTIDDMLDLGDLNPALKTQTKNRYETVHPTGL